MRCQAFSITVTEEWTMKEVKREVFEFFLVFEWFFTREPKSQFLLDARRLIEVDLKKTADKKSPEVGGRGGFQTGFQRSETLDDQSPGKEWKLVQ